MLSPEAKAATYYVSPSGKDTNSGRSSKSAWKTLAEINRHAFAPGDRILLEGGKTFSGGLTFNARSQGRAARPIVLGSFGKGHATVQAGEGTAIRLYNTAGFRIENLILRGDWDAEKQSGNAGSGIELFNDKNGAVTLDFVRIENIEASGFKQAGFRIGGLPADNSKSGFRDVTITRCIAHNNGQAGIESYGPFGDKVTGYAHHNIVVHHCRLYSNRGIANMGGHSGNGVVLGDVDGAVIERCVAYNNGELSNYDGGGPVGIWAWDSNHVLIQYCESYGNKSATTDGGGFDLDGGCTNSIMQYNYSHDNVGAGYLFAQFGGARPFVNNVARYNISENDGRKNGYAGLQFWNGGSGIVNCAAYQNTVFVSPAPTGTAKALRFMTPTTDTLLANNLLITTHGLPLIEFEAEQSGLRCIGNAYWSSGNPFLVLAAGKRFDSLDAWRTATGQERLGEKPTGLFADPLLNAPGKGGTIGDADRLKNLRAYRLKSNSPLRGAGLPLTQPPFRLSVGKTDFYETSLPSHAHPTIGASEGATP